MLPNFLVKATVGQRNCLSFNNNPAIRQFRELRSYLIEGASREAATLFAEPVVTQKGDELEIAWYAEPSGQPISLYNLDADVRRLVTDKLDDTLRTLAPLLSGPLGALLARAFYVMDEGSILAVGQTPVLINWGIVGDDVDVADQRALTDHYNATLGRYTSLAAPPIVRRSFVSPPPVASEPLPAQAASLDAPLLARRHIRLCIATALAAALALVLALPGVLGKHAATADAGLVSTADAQKITEAMREKVAKARGALAAATCLPGGSLDAPDKKADLPPADIPVGSPPVKGDMALVARRATQSVVMVLTCVTRETWDAKHKDDKEPHDPLACPTFDAAPAADPPQSLVAFGTGSGFFVAARTVVTNLHVVDNAAVVYVTGRGLPHVLRATVKATTAAKTRVDAPDFAVLDLDIDRSPPPITLSTTTSLLQDVVSAGYPGVILDEDPQLHALLQGDANAVPELTTYPGAITLIKGLDADMPLIFSSAVIGHGNSGGPLMDLCGEAVGMNTLGWSGKEEDTGYKVNVAEGAKALAAFLDASKIQHATTDRACVPGAQTALETPPEQAIPSPPTATPPAPAPQGQR